MGRFLCVARLDLWRITKAASEELRRPSGTEGGSEKVVNFVKDRVLKGVVFKGRG